MVTPFVLYDKNYYYVIIIIMRLINKKNIDESFYEFFNNSEVLDEIKNIENFLFDVELEKNFYPYTEEVLRFAHVNLNNIKCIILGMDPYPSDFMDDVNKKLIPIATGRSFEVRNLKSWLEHFKQSSLQNILKSIYYLEKGKILDLNKIREEIIKKEFNILEPPLLWEDLEKQGVLWLNAIFTVKVHKSGSHINIWKNFTDKLIKYIIKNNPKIKWLIWGEIAKNRVDKLVAQDNIIYTCHPASRTKNNFVESCPFKYVDGIAWSGKNK